ncbi:hypothetical protein ASE86_13800 [Sphingomonas sp. Leaf33]|uniref:hypothetical protein n=1 Tax=Sphingomonas sp. Leaf33 TaxID=1736215 RepID=UPI0006FD8CBF|nr:hypothetical protein [Sphingomonas sp. Leaf33]KQN19529.1 hypothetical protein ASE86_13800 [Sphingomonas sp. Leaf33]
MSEPTETYFSVAADNEAAAVAHVTARGFLPLRIERVDDGISVLVFAPLPDDQMFGLAQALPIHLSSKIGIVGGPLFK